MDSEDPVLTALIELHAGLERQGPGDARFTRQMLERLPALPDQPRVADLGCGSGAAALVLAEVLQVPVTAVDLSRRFLEELDRRANQRGLSHLVRPIQADMGKLPWAAESLDLLWSEGAAYHLTFEGALRTWRPLLPTGGLAVISELTLYAQPLPDEVCRFWNAGYPSAGSEEQNARHAISTGYEVLAIERLPQEAWWNNYYGPLESHIAEADITSNPAMHTVIAETKTEIDLFRRFGDTYGYSFYLLRSV